MTIVRIDVDYPYSSRLRSFISVGLDLRTNHSYLKNAKIIAKMINESKGDVKAYWFFTTKTPPDEELRILLDSSKHDIGLHVVNDPNEEKRVLEGIIARRIENYTIHGTRNLLARIIWKRWKQAPRIPSDFPLHCFHQYVTFGLDRLCYFYDPEEAFKKANDNIKQGQVLYFHPIWLFQRGKLNQRGRFYEVWKRILNVDKEIEMLHIQNKFSLKMAKDAHEYEKDAFTTETLFEKLADRGIDIFSLIERRWCSFLPKPPESWSKTEDNVALLEVTTYNDWLKQIGKKTRNMVRKADKSGVRVEIADPNEALAEGIWRIYNETPIRQDRAFPHYGQSLKSVRGLVERTNDTFIGAHLQNELVGFIQLVSGDRTTVISQILSLQRHSDKAVNNALIAAAINFCASQGCRWLIYARMGNHPSLDNFKRNNGFSKFEISRYHVPLTENGRIALRLGLHREIKDILPEKVKYLLIPVYNWVSRTKIHLKRK